MENVLLSRPLLNEQGASCLKKVVDDFGQTANYDYSNNISADDLLNFIYLYETENVDELLDMLCIQFNEMISGLCPQGRTHRLFQVVILLLSEKE